MFCHKCGAEINSSDRFCYKCGISLNLVVNAETGKISNNDTLPVSKQLTKLDTDTYKLPEVKIKKICSLSLLSFILSFLLVFGSLPSFILSIISLIRIKKAQIEGKGLAVSALIISGLTILFFIVVLIANLFSGFLSTQRGGII